MQTSAWAGFRFGDQLHYFEIETACFVYIFSTFNQKFKVFGIVHCIFIFPRLQKQGHETKGSPQKSCITIILD